MTASPVLILLRHGQAEPFLQDDASRALVPAGTAEVERSCAFLRARGWLPERVLASPYRRAQQSAEVVRRILVPHAVVETEPMLVPGSEPQLTADLLSALADRNLLVATHMPLVAELVRALTGRDAGFATGGLAVLQRDPQQWQLLAQFQPDK